MPRSNLAVGAVGLAVALTLGAGAASAQDKTLSEGRPLLHLADAFPIATGEGAALGGAGVTRQRASPNRGFLPLEIQYGVFPHTQVSLGTQLSSHPHDADDPRAGDLHGSLRVNFGRESYFVPSFATQLTVTVPTGVDANATNVELKGYATKTVTHSLFGHFNASVDVTDHVARDERAARYHLAGGASYTVPEKAAVLLAADVFTDQARRIGDPNTVGGEAGIRIRVTPAVYWDAGIGSEFAGPRDRAVLFVTTGVTVNFSLD